MNTGLQDAYNLAWKLALVAQGKARPQLLETYNEERLPVARKLLATTDRGFKLVVSDSWLASLLRTKAARAHRRIRHVVRARAENCLPRRFADRHKLRRKFAVEISRPPA